MKPNKNGLKLITVKNNELQDFRYPKLKDKFQWAYYQRYNQPYLSQKVKIPDGKYFMVCNYQLGICIPHQLIVANEIEKGRFEPSIKHSYVF